MISSISSKLIPVYHVNGCLNTKAIDTACDLLLRGGVLGIPTDTIYGILGMAQEPTVVSRIYKIKGRSNCKPIAICLSSVKDIPFWSKVTVSQKLLTSLLPGPYTLIFERSPKLNKHLNPETNLIGIRVPNHPFIISLASRIDEPLALTSANISNKPSCISTNEFKEIWPLLDGIFDGGDLTEDPNKLGSTVIDLSCEGHYKIVRPGCAFDKALLILENQFGLIRLS